MPSTIRPGDTLYDAHYVAAQLGLKVGTVYRMVQAGEIECVRVGRGGRTLRFTERQIADYLNARRERK